MNRDADQISGTMTTVMVAYSAIFMRFALKVKPQNLFLFSCHACNEVVQLYTLGRLIKYEMSVKKQQEGAEAATATSTTSTTSEEEKVL